jgi:hypothetical protein
MTTGTRIESEGGVPAGEGRPGMPQYNKTRRQDLMLLGHELDTRVSGIDGILAHFLARSALQIRSRSGRNVPLAPNRVQREYERRRGQQNIILKARQLGVSTWVAARFFLKTALVPGTLTVQVAHTQEAAESLFRMVHRFHRLLPADACESMGPVRANVRQLIFPEIDSEYRVETAGDRNAGRGLTISNLHCSEVARWPGDASETLQGLRAALAPEGELVLESTPMGASGCFWREWQDAEETGVVRHFFPWWWEEAYVTRAVEAKSLTGEERTLRAQHGLTLEQIGYRRLVQRRYRELARQEFAETAHECFLASGECYFDTGAIDRRIGEVANPVETRLGGKLQIWFPPQRGRRYIVAVDPAGGGTQGDYSAAQVIDSQTGLQCAELQTHSTVLETAEAAANLAREYGNALIAVERNNHGSAVIAYLRSVCHYDHLFQQGGQDGWLTTSISRPQMLASLASALVETPVIFSSRRLLMECRSFVRKENGRMEAQAGEHDDCVLAMAIALAVRAGR